MPALISSLCIARAGALMNQLTPESPPELFAEIGTIFSEWEERFPGAPLWDRMRTNMAMRMYDETHVRAATELIHGMRSAHNQADTVVVISLQHPDDDELLSGLVRQFQQDPDNTRHRRFLQAAHDRIIDANPDSPEVDGYEEILRSQDPAYDPVQSWIDSQREAAPAMPWDGAHSALNDPRWEDTPMPWRMHMVKSAYHTSRHLGAEVSTELIMSINSVLDYYADRFPDIVMWDHYRVQFGAQLVEAGDPAFAFDFARSIRDVVHQHWMAEIFMAKGYREESTELWTIVRDRIRRGDTGKWEVAIRE